MNRSLVLPACAALLLVGPATVAGAGGPHGHPHAAAVAPGMAPGFAAPTGVAVPIPTAARSPYLGTFRPDPTLIMRSGYTTGGSYDPGGIPGNYAVMSLYGPFSRLRSTPSEVVTYSRGYDGVLRPTGSAITYEYPDPRPYRDTTLVPTGMRFDPFTGRRTRSGFGRYLLGQE